MSRPAKFQGRLTLRALVLVFVISLLWWAVGRLTAPERRLAVRESIPVEGRGGSPDEVRILTWNIAHGRGGLETGLLKNWRGGRQEERLVRLSRMAEVIEEANADVVILNEVDFHAEWSHGLNQAEVLARMAHYPFRVEQRNYDLRLPLLEYSFGNAVLSRFPVVDVHWVTLPPYSRLERIVLGAKNACVVRLKTPVGPLAVVPVHLESRSSDTRLAAVPVLAGIRGDDGGAPILAGDFNAAPSGWTEERGTTALDSLLAMGWASLRAESPPPSGEMTFPSVQPERGLDWVLVPPPLETTFGEVLQPAIPLSDHAPVLVGVTRPDTAWEAEGAGKSASGLRGRLHHLSTGAEGAGPGV